MLEGLFDKFDDDSVLVKVIGNLTDIIIRQGTMKICSNVNVSAQVRVTIKERVYVSNIIFSAPENRIARVTIWFK